MRPDFCLVNAIARRVVTASPLCHERDRWVHRDRRDRNVAPLAGSDPPGCEFIVRRFRNANLNAGVINGPYGALVFRPNQATGG